MSDLEASNDGRVRVRIIHGLNISHKELTNLLQKSTSHQNQALHVVVLSLTVEWGVGVEGQDLSYGEVGSTRGLRGLALLGGSNSPTSRSPEAVDWIMREITGGANPCLSGGGWLI